MDADPPLENFQFFLKLIILCLKLFVLFSEGLVRLHVVGIFCAFDPLDLLEVLLVEIRFANHVFLQSWQIAVKEF